jgi:glycosyltransferase involved in cell wall biosynthesis
VRFSVIITTYNRVDTLPRAVASVLSQDGVTMELIIVDDGSTDETASFLEKIHDPRIAVLHRTNGGLSAARNTGLAQASGDWTTFLDDDDTALPGWLAGFASLIDDQVGLVCCGAEYRTPEGTRVGTRQPAPMGGLFRDQTALMLAGAFAVRSDLLRLIGGYDERLTCSHQTELALRLMPAMLDRSLHARHTDRTLVSIERRDPEDRPMSNPAALYHGIPLILDKHRDKYAGYPRSRARSYGVLGVSAARLGLWSQARSALLTSARTEPLNIQRWFRLATAFCPPVANHVWHIADYQRQVQA